jgi:hypothetical protein
MILLSGVISWQRTLFMSATIRYAAVAQKMQPVE